MTAYTRKDAEQALERLAAACHKGTESFKAGNWGLDKAYGAYKVVEYVTGYGKTTDEPAYGEREPLGGKRRTPKEFVQFVDAAISGICAAREQQVNELLRLQRVIVSAAGSDGFPKHENQYVSLSDVIKIINND